MSECLIRGDQTMFYNLMKKRCINHEEFSDCVFLVGPKKQLVYGHKCILAARSDAFRSLFSKQAIQDSPSANPTYIIPNVRLEVFLTSLDYLYTNCCTLTNDLASDLVSFSVDYGLEELTRFGAQFLLDSLSCQTACDVLDVAVSHALPEMLQKALEYVMRHAKEIMQSDGFQELSPEALGLLLRGDEVNSDEMEILCAVKKWIKNNSIITGRTIKDLTSQVIPLIRLPLFSAEELTEIENENKPEGIIPVEQLAAAWRFHALKENTPMSHATRLRIGTARRESHKHLPKDK